MPTSLNNGVRWPSTRTTQFWGKSFTYVGRELQMWREFESAVIETGLRYVLLRPNENFLDVGGLWGSWSIPAALIGCNVVTMEPNPANRARLIEHITMNNLNNKIRVCDSAAWNEDGEAMTNGWNVGRGDQKVKTIRIDSLLPELPHIDFMKLDVEEAEVKVIEGAQELIKRDNPRILIECHTHENYLKLTQQLGAQLMYPPTGGTWHIYAGPLVPGTINIPLGFRDEKTEALQTESKTYLNPT
jgi:FkbM family methyltransferase